MKHTNTVYMNLALYCCIKTCLLASSIVKLRCVIFALDV